MLQILQGHTSFETAYIIEDYPYGFRLRCKQAVWIEECKKGAKKGEFRLVTRTTNPKAAGEVWNKPKTGTYSRFLLMGLNDEGHVVTTGFSDYCPTDQVKAFFSTYKDVMTDEQRKFVGGLIGIKEAVDEHFRQNPIKFTITEYAPVNIFDL